MLARCVVVGIVLIECHGEINILVVVIRDGHACFEVYLLACFCGDVLDAVENRACCVNDCDIERYCRCFRIFCSFDGNGAAAEFAKAHIVIAAVKCKLIAVAERCKLTEFLGRISSVDLGSDAVSRGICLHCGARAVIDTSLRNIVAAARKCHSKQASRHEQLCYLIFHYISLR